MELTLEQQRAARACGFSFFPATEAQVQRLTMQKRIFRLGGQPFMATRDGAFWETHGTLMRLIPEQGPGEPQIATQEPELPPQPGQAIKGDAAAPAQVAVEPAGIQAALPEEVTRTQAKSPRRRRAGAEVAPRQDSDKAASANTEAIAIEHAVADAPQVVEASGEVPVESGDERGSAVHRPRSRQPKEPRWATAGKERRGRLK